MITDTERMAKIGELLRLRGLLITAHEEQIERVDSRLRILYPADFRELVATARARSRVRPHLLEWWAGQRVHDDCKR